MDCDPDRDSEDADPDNHPRVMSLKRTFNVVRNSFLVGEVFGGPFVFGWRCHIRNLLRSLIFKSFGNLLGDFGSHHSNSGVAFKVKDFVYAALDLWVVEFFVHCVFRFKGLPSRAPQCLIFVPLEQ
jgi:hypothetical protein